MIIAEPYIEGQGLFSEDPLNALYEGFQFNFTGQPKVGDIFDIEFNANGVSDNRNAESLASFGTKTH